MGAQVRHGKYGDGAVVGQADDIITVRFSVDGGTKKFLYPSIFEQYLTLCSDELQAQQLDELKQQRANLEADAARKLAENENRKKAADAHKPSKKAYSVRRKTPKKIDAE
jgi:hypothetical protein